MAFILWMRNPKKELSSHLSGSLNPLIHFATTSLLLLLVFHHPREAEAATCSRSDLSSLSPPLGLTHNMNSALLGGGGVIQYSCDKTQNLYVRVQSQ